MQAQLDPAAVPTLGWRDWLATHFASYVSAPFAERHVRFWEWITALRAGVRPRPRVEAWPRGGGKSTTIELACAYLGAQPHPQRHFVLYVSETQAQADAHIQSIARMLEQVGVRRAVNEYGASRGWRHQELRTASGFNVMAFGLDAGMRGIKLDAYRPDIIIGDDIDGRHDTAQTTQKKIETLTESILPAGSPDVAVIVVQNLVHRDSIMSQLCDGRADFLNDREPPTVEQAVAGLEYRQETDPDGRRRYVITAGEPTWEGQNLATCERQLNAWGSHAFLREAQQDVRQSDGGLVKRHWWRFWQREGDTLPPVLAQDDAGRAVAHEVVTLPALCERAALSWDMSFKKTEDGSYVVGLAGQTWGPNVYVTDRYRARASFGDSIQAILAMRAAHPHIVTTLVEDAANGPAVIDTLNQHVPGIVPVRPDGSKEARLTAITPLIEAGNVILPHPRIAPWVDELIDELAAFPNGAHDDQVDSLSMLCRYLMPAGVNADSAALIDAFFRAPFSGGD